MRQDELIRVVCPERLFERGNARMTKKIADACNSTPRRIQNHSMLTVQRIPRDSQRTIYSRFSSFPREFIGSRILSRLRETLEQYSPTKFSRVQLIWNTISEARRHKVYYKGMLVRKRQECQSNICTGWTGCPPRSRTKASPDCCKICTKIAHSWTNMRENF